MFLVLFSITPFPASRRGIWVRVSRQAHLERQMLCLQGHPRILRILRDVRFLLGEALPGTNLAANAAVRYPRATHSPAPVLVRSLRTCPCFLCPANVCTGRMTLDHLLNLLSCLFVLFPPKRCDTISPWPHLLSVTSRQVGTKLAHVLQNSSQLGMVFQRYNSSEVGQNYQKRQLQSRRATIYIYMTFGTPNLLL